MSKTSISFTGKTDKGKVRTNNEDALIYQYIWDKNHVLAVAIDGVGGHEGGEVAADIAKKTIIDYLEKYPNGERIELLKQAVIEANNLIVEERNKQPQYSKMSCVLTVSLIELEKRQFNMVHVGDTRLYQYRKQELKKLSHDHSLVGYREEIGDLTEQEAMNHPQRNVISRDIGSELHKIDDTDFLESVIFPLLPNSTLLLCSDGLSDLLISEEIVSILRTKSSLNRKAQDLIDLANNKGGKDNITVVLVQYNSNEPDPTERVSEVIYTDNSDNIEAKSNNSEKIRLKKKWLPALISSIVLLSCACLGGGIGWWSHSKYANVINNSTKVDSIKIEKRDTFNVLSNDSLRIFVSGSKIKIDTVKLK